MSAIFILSELNSVCHFYFIWIKKSQPFYLIWINKYLPLLVIIISLNQKVSGILILSESKSHFNFILVIMCQPFSVYLNQKLWAIFF